MDPYEYFNHPYWDTRKSRRPGKKYVNPYMPDQTEGGKHGSEFGGQSMMRPYQHFQEISTPGEGGISSHSNSTTSDNTRVEGTSSNLAAREMVRQKIQDQLRVARETPSLGTAQSSHLHYGQLQQDTGHASDFIHQYPANLHQQQPLQHEPGTFYHSPYTSNAFQQQQQSVGHDPGNFMAPFGHQMSPPQQHPVATAGGYQPNFYHSSPAPNQAAYYQRSPVLHHSQFNTNFNTNHSAFNTPNQPNFNHSPFPDHPFPNLPPSPRPLSPQRSPQQHFASTSPTPAATPRLLSPKTRRRLTLTHLDSMQTAKKTLLARQRDLHDERRTIETRIADIKTRSVEDKELEDDSRVLVRLEGLLGGVEGKIEGVSKDWDWVEGQVEEGCAEIAVGGWA